MSLGPPQSRLALALNVLDTNFIGSVVSHEVPINGVTNAHA